jgi:hypothetical protein
MTRRSRCGLIIAFVLAATSAHADVTKQDCVDANTKAQSLQRDGKLRASRDALLVCASASCPAIVRDDCTQQLDALNRKLPSILFEVKDADGNDVSAVSITMDGQPLADHVGVTPIPIDPGDHVFTFTMGSSPPITKHFLVREGEKDRHERVVMGGGAAAPVVQPTAQPTPVVVHEAVRTGKEVRVHFQQPEASYTDATETWTLRNRGGTAICQLPCIQSVGTSSGYFLDAVVSRSNGEVVHQSLRIDVPDNLDRLPGTEVQLVSKPGYGSPNAALALGVTGLVLFAGGILTWVFVGMASGEAGAWFGITSPGWGSGVVCGVVGLVWGLNSQRGKFELSPLGASLQTTSGVKIRFSASGFSGSF